MAHATLVDDRCNRRDMLVLILVAAGFNLCANIFNSNMFYDQMGWEDPFRHLGIGLYYADPAFSDLNYKISRVPWNTLQFVVRQLFTTEAAGAVLQLVCGLGRALVLYSLGRRLFRRDVALSVGVLAIFLPLFHADGGADYYNAGAVPLYYLTWLSMAAWVWKPSSWNAFATGLLTAATLHTCPQFILTGPMLMIAGVAMSRFAGRTWSQMGRAVVLQFVGVLAATALFALWHGWLGRRTAFFLPQLAIVNEMRGHNRWWLPFEWNWLQSSAHSAFMAAVGLMSVVELVRLLRVRHRDARALVYIGFYLGYLATYTTGLVLQAKGQTIFQPDYQAQMLVASAFLAFGCVCQTALFGVDTGDHVEPGFIVRVLLPVACVVLLFLGATRGRPLSLPSFGFVPAVAAIGVYYTSIRLGVLRGPVGLLALAVVNAALIVYPDLYTVDLCHGRRRLTALMVEASLQGTRLVSDPEDLKVWADRDAVLEGCTDGTRVADVAASFTRMAHRELAHSDNPAPFSEEQASSGIVVYLTSRTAGHDEFRDQARMAGVDLTPLAFDHDPATGLRFYFDRFARHAPH